jgi:hypothetical protein
VKPHNAPARAFFGLLGQASQISWALLASDRDGERKDIDPL